MNTLSEIPGVSQGIHGINRSIIGRWIHAIKIIIRDEKSIQIAHFHDGFVLGAWIAWFGIQIHESSKNFAKWIGIRCWGIDRPCKFHTPSWDGLLGLLERHQAFFEMTQIASYWSTIVFFSFCWTSPCFIPLIIPCLEATLAASHCQS